MRNHDNEQTTQWRFTEQMGADDATAQISLPPSDETTVMAVPVTERVYGTPAAEHPVPAPESPATESPASESPASESPAAAAPPPVPGSQVPAQSAPEAATEVAVPEVAAQPAAGPAGSDRGRTTIASDVIERVVDRLVQLAVAEADGVVGLHPGVDRFFGESEVDIAKDSAKDLAKDLAEGSGEGSGEVPAEGSGEGSAESSAEEQSVAVRIEDRRAEINIAIEVEFGHPVHEAVEQVRASVIESAERLLGLTVTEVNVAVTGVAFPSAE